MKISLIVGIVLVEEFSFDELELSICTDMFQQNGFFILIVIEYFPLQEGLFIGNEERAAWWLRFLINTWTPLEGCLVHLIGRYQLFDFII